MQACCLVRASLVELHAQYRENAGCVSAESAEPTCKSVAVTVVVTREVSSTDSAFFQAVSAKREEVPGLFAYRCVTAHYLSIRFQATFTCNSLVHSRHSSHRFQRRRSVQSARDVLSPRNTGNRASHIIRYVGTRSLFPRYPTLILSST
jgi:hypothetical protein